MRIGRGSSKQARSKGCQIALSNEDRVRSAGRRGTKNFVDPNNLFLGNLSYDATEDHLIKFLVQTVGINKSNFKKAKIVRDWKTGESKGYGFVEFRSPIFATSALELIKGKKILGRVVRINQGKKKTPDPIVLMDKKKGKPQDLEEEIITDALSDAEENLDNDIDYEEIELQILENGLFNDKYDDSILFADEEDDDDFAYDGTYVEEYEKDDDDGDGDQGPTNREQRRENLKKKTRRKKLGKGFGTQTT